MIAVFRRIVGICIGMCVVFSIQGKLFAYTPNTRDVSVQERIDTQVSLVSDGGKEKLVSVFAQVNTLRIPYKENDRYLYLLEYIMQSLTQELQGAHEVSIEWDSRIPEEEPETLIKEEVEMLEEVDEENFAVEPTTPVIHSITTSTDVQEFYSYYASYLTDTTPISDLCTKYYAEIDQIAKEHDFPTAVIIATWWREHTCIFSNPDNTWGNFQIITDYYAPGDITRNQFKQQVIDFINFSKGKRARYDNIQVFGPAPVNLGYDRIDLLSLRKQAILYNGVAKGTTPENNIYANQNFGSPDSGRDGVVAMTLKGIGYGLALAGEEIAIISQENKVVDGENDEQAQQDVMVEKTCEEQFLVNLSPGDDSLAVKEMQIFLAEQGFFFTDATGYYGDLTTQAVNAFQAYYKSAILDPGGYTEPTDQWYPATRSKANEVACG